MVYLNSPEVVARPPTNEQLGLIMKLNEISLYSTDWRSLLKEAFIIAILGGCIAIVIEADHTSDLPFIAGFALWFTHILLASCFFLTCFIALQRIKIPDIVAAFLTTLILPMLIAPVSILLDYGFGNPDEELTASEAPLSIYFSEILAVIPFTIIVSLIMIFLLRRAALKNKTPLKSTSDKLSLTELIEAVPHSLGNDIIRMHAQDHYVEIVTTKGSALLTEKFGDCVEKLEPLNGIQCHRSHWVSIDHIQNVSRSGSSYTCILSNGDEVPISRRRYAEIKSRISQF